MREHGIAKRSAYEHTSRITIWGNHGGDKYSLWLLKDEIKRLDILLVQAFEKHEEIYKKAAYSFINQLQRDKMFLGEFHERKRNEIPF